MEKIKKSNYTWVIVILSFLMIFISMGFCTTTKGIFVAPITEALDIKRSTYSLNSSFQYVTTFLVNLFFGTLIARFGIKKLILAGQACLITSSLIFAFVSTPIGFYIGGIFLGLGAAWSSTSMIGCIVNRWCKKHKGTIMGFIFAANGVGGAVGTMLLTPIIYQNGNPFGYRNAYLLMMCFVIAVAIIILFFFKEKPEQSDDVVLVEKKSAKTDWQGISFFDASKKCYFYGAAICALLVGMIMQGVNTVMAAHLKDVGFDAVYAASVISIYSVTLAIGKFISGVIYDRFGLRANVFICTISMFCALILMCVINTSVTGKIFAVVFAVFTGIALPLETVLIPIYVGELFGGKDYNKIVGIFESLTNAGFALGVPLMNLAYDIFGSYKNAFYISAVLMVGVFIILNLVINSAAKLKKEMQ